MDSSILVLQIALVTVAVVRWTCFLGGLLAGVLTVLAISEGVEEWPAQSALVIAATTVLCGPAGYFVYNYFISPHLGVAELPSYFVWIYFAGLVLGCFAGFFLLRHFSQKIDVWKSRMTNKNPLERKHRTDVRNISSFLPSPIPDFDPRSYFRAGMYFIGINPASKEPVYWDLEKSQGRLPHVQVTGTTGSGKGVFLGMVSAQSLHLGSALVYLDPKFDEWAPFVVHAAAKAAGVSYRFIDLRTSAPPQLNLFEGATMEEIEELFLAGFSLSDRGEAADFYRVSDRKAARVAAQAAASVDGHTPESLYSQLGDDLEEDAPYFVSMLAEMASVPAVNGNGGFSLERLVKEGGAAYVVGSMRNIRVVRLQRMVLVRLLQLCERRDRSAGAMRPVVAVLDEFKTHISKPPMEALQGARDKGLSVVMAHQSIADLRDCPKDLDPESVVGGVMENGKLKVLYQVQDPDTAEWLAKKSGTTLVDDEIRSVRKNLALSEVVSGERSIRQAETYAVDTNQMLNLPKQVAVVFGLSKTEFVQTAAVRVTKDPEALVVVEVDASVIHSSGSPTEAPGEGGEKKQRKRRPRRSSEASTDTFEDPI